VTAERVDESSTKSVVEKKVLIAYPVAVGTEGLVISPIVIFI
jgi:hypothetical protein